MAKYRVIVNDEERVANDDPSDIVTARDDIGELLRSGYYEVESVEEIVE